MEVDLLDFVQQFRQLAKLEKHAVEPARGRLDRWKSVVLQCVRRDDGHSYRETPNRLRYMAEVRDVIDLD